MRDRVQVVEGKLPSFGRPQAIAPGPPRRGARWLERRLRRYQPGAILGVFALLVAIPLLLDFTGAADWLDDLETTDPIAVNLLEHVLVAALVAAAAFYWLFGLKRQRALRRYRKLAQSRPDELVDWSRGNPSVRRRASELLAEAIERSGGPALAVVQGRTGSGRTSFLVGLVQDLAKRGLLPIPVLAKRDGSFELEELARVKFCRQIDQFLDSDRETDEIWHRARSTRDVVVLVDGVDDEVVKTLWGDKGARLTRELASLRQQKIAVVLASTADLPLGDITPLREDLDLFSRAEAEAYLDDALREPQRALDALRRLDDPADDFLIAPFYLELLVRLSGEDLDRLPPHRDRWRAAVLGAYLDGVRAGRIAPPPTSAEDDTSSARGRRAVHAATAAAPMLQPERDSLTVRRRRLKVGDAVLADAVDLNLLSLGVERVGFTSDDLGAYLLAATIDDVSQLLEAIRRVAHKPRGRRADRFVLTTLIFWHMRSDSGGRLACFDRLLTELESAQTPRPAVVVAAVRIASACALVENSDRVAAVTRRCIDALPADAEPAELRRLVRALADWRHAEAHRLLWRLATRGGDEVQWPAAKALASAREWPAESLRDTIEETLAHAESDSTPEAMSRPGDDLGRELVALAWILPTLRRSDGVEAQLERVKRLCLDPQMSPLRGEMSLAQGLKLAVVNGREADVNVTDVRRLLLERDGGLTFWQARLALVHALLVDGWTSSNRAREHRRELASLRNRERHRLVRSAIDLARRGLAEHAASPDDGRPSTGYMWTHERDAVRWVEQGKAEVARLAADAVLLSNMTYLAREVDLSTADRVARDSEVPRCIRKSTDRNRIAEGEGCDCKHGLCDKADNPVAAARAPFSESFCREQARLARRAQPPWMARALLAYRARHRLEDFWDGQATRVRRAAGVADD